MSTIQEFRKEVLISSKFLYTAQASQFKDFKDDIKKLSSLVASIKAENALLRQEVICLRKKFQSLNVQIHLHLLLSSHMIYIKLMIRKNRLHMYLHKI